MRLRHRGALVPHRVRAGHVPAAVTATAAMKAQSVETAPGPVDDPARAPEGLRFETTLPPADRLEDVADHDEPARVKE